MKESEIWEKIADADGNRYIMTASCLRDYEGLIGGHAYTIIGIIELQKGEKLTQQLIQLRDPIGTEEYTGPWNNQDTRWTTDYKKQANFKDSNSFYMPVKQFKKAFQNFDITYYHENWKQSSFNQIGTAKQWTYPISFIRDQDIFFTFDSLPARIQPPGCPKLDTNQYNLILRDQGGKLISQEPVSKKTGYGVIYKQNLTAGDYQLIVMNFGDPESGNLSESDFTVSTYAEETIEILEQ